MNPKVEKKSNSFFKEIKIILSNKYLILAFIFLIITICINFASESYLYRLNNEQSLPVLSDFLLNNLPYYNIFWIADWTIFILGILFLIFIIEKKQHRNIPYFFIIFSAFYIIRGIFLVLNPIGNPELFTSANSIFNGFSKYQIGTFPSAHIGISSLFLLLSKRIYRYLAFIGLIIIIVCLLLSKGHYSIDILAAIIFAYAIYAFGEKYLKSRLEIK